MHSEANTANTATPANIAEFISNHGVDLSWQDSFYQWMHENPELSLSLIHI